MEDFKMKRIFIVVVAVLELITGGVIRGLYAQDSTEKGGVLTVPWTEFKKLLNLDENEIVFPLETFHKLLAQTGIQTPPPHAVEEGNVVMTRTEFKKLVDQMKPPATPEDRPPFDYLITRAVYTGKVQQNNTAFRGVFHVQVLKKGGYLKVPLLPQNLALEDLKIGGRQALVVTEGGYHQVIFSQEGEYEVSASFSLKSSLDRGPHKIDLPIQQTPITLLNLEIPLADIDVEIPQAQHLQSEVGGLKTAVVAVITPGRAISVRWRKQVAVAEKIPPKLYSEIYHLISIEDDVLKTKSDINYNILHSEVDAVRLVIPEGMSILAVSGEGVGEWQEMTLQEQRILVIPFTYSKKGAVTVHVTAETPLSDAGMANVFSGIRVLDAVRETGFIGIELNTSAEVIVTETGGLENLPVQRLPVQLINKSVKPLMMGFKYLKHPFHVVLDVRKHEKIPVPVATINTANVVTLFTEDGKLVNRLIYQVKNSAKQFLEIRLPEKADVWSVFVGNQPVESSINGQGKMLIPLLRSHAENNRLNAFPVEVIYALSEDKFSWFGSRETILPSVDLMTSQIIWSIYLPNDYSYMYFKSTLEKEEMIRGLNVFSGVQRQYNEEAMKEVFQSGDEESSELRRDKLEKAYGGKEYKSRFRNVPLEEDQLSGQVAAELEFGGRLEGLARQNVAPAGTATGVLPIQIQIPIAGQVYRFARTIIKTDDPLSIKVVHVQFWVIDMVKWITLVLVIGILFLIRKGLEDFRKWLKGKLSIMVKYYQKHQSVIEKYARSRMTPFVLFGLVMIVWPVSIFLEMILLFLLWISVVYHVLNYRKKKAQETTKPEASATP
jgi:hypothetical protein